MSRQAERLILFTKVPRPGSVKTRLIPLLGEVGAQKAHCELTRIAIAAAERSQAVRRLDLEIQYVGGSESDLRESFPGDYFAAEQSPGDLGNKLSGAFREAFADGAERVVIIGSDCPDIDERCLTEAFRRLHDDDMVIGPARDGGYYLIGLSRYCETLFRDMPWSESNLFERTMGAAKREGLSSFQLKVLSDIDRPEDWLRWTKSYRARNSKESASFAQSNEARSDDADSPWWIGVTAAVRLSILIPVYRDNEALAACLSHLKPDARTEVIVASAEPDDEASAICKRYGAVFLVCDKGRARQLNAAAKVAQGNILLSLHADSRLPTGYLAEIEDRLRIKGVAGGAFRLAIDNPNPAYRRLAKWANRRSRWLRLPYGDQGLFVSRQLFVEMGGYRDLPIMEDFEFVRRLAKRGEIAISSLAVTTSDRRWKQFGMWRVTLLNQLIVVGYYLGVSPNRLAKWYRQGRVPGRDRKS